MKLRICYLYPNLMNMYGDRGNIIALKNRAERRNIEVFITKIDLKQKLELDKFDLFFIGGGQDREQKMVCDDFQKIKGKSLKEATEQNKVILGICGGYQLFGSYFKTHTGEELAGINILDCYTIASNQRMIGNVLVELDSKFPLKEKTLVGFENHSGKTFLGKNVSPLGKVLIGYGNNGKDGFEGANYKNVFGTYLHGSFLPKNPDFTDFLILKSLENKYDIESLDNIDNGIEQKAHKEAMERAYKTKTIHL